MAGVNSGEDIRKTLSSEISQWESYRTDRGDLDCQREWDRTEPFIEVVARSVVLPCGLRGKHPGKTAQNAIISIPHSLGRARFHPSVFVALFFQFRSV